MEAMNEPKKAETDIIFPCICSNVFKILISFNLILPYIKMLYSQLIFV